MKGHTLRMGRVVTSSYAFSSRVDFSEDFKQSAFTVLAQIEETPR